MPTSGFAFNPAFCTASISRSQSSVEAEDLALVDIPPNGLRPLRQDVLDEPTSRDQDVVPVAEIDEICHRLPGHERE
jgi:hypothetical protein